MDTTELEVVLSCKERTLSRALMRGDLVLEDGRKIAVRNMVEVLKYR